MAAKACTCTSSGECRQLPADTGACLPIPMDTSECQRISRSPAVFHMTNPQIVKQTTDSTAEMMT